ncbi:serine aminopeptidase domain-containing protein [Pendulispora albinea]|uniref:Alpha/beta hydrolase n=1 Tax=Pendulispora albinea TaxID=2741071 RepID=A0ABZ2M6X8_9BACT
MNHKLPTPLFFGPADRALFGWIHRPSASVPHAKLGLVVCNPFGYEAVCAHRSLRHFAVSAAAAGVPAMRFDYDGTGNSDGNDLDPNRVKAWLDSIHHAIETLRASTGVASVCLLGLRLGALLAAVAASERDDVSGLIAVAPVLSGKMYVRELRMLQSALALSTGPAPGSMSTAPARPDAPTAPASKAAPPLAGDEVHEAVGFALTAVTKTSLAAIDLLRQERRPPPSVLVLDRVDLPGADKWAERLAASGAKVDVRRLPGYVEMMLDPHRAEPPLKMIHTSTTWLKERAAAVSAPSRPLQDAPASAPSLATAATRATSATTATMADGSVIERAIYADDARTLFGIVTSAAPGTATSTGVGILLLNAGAVHHIGPNRLYTELARRWAALGHIVLRLDQSGIGDSRARPGEAENVVYSGRALEDVAAALAFLRRAEGVRECRAIGLCSGAYHAFKSAVAGQPVDGVIAINPLTFFWKDGETPDDTLHKTVESIARYSQALSDARKWRKLARGEVNIRAAVRTIARHTTARMVDRARHLSRQMGLPLPGDLGAELESVARRGVDMRFVLATGDPGLSLLRMQGGAVVRKLRSRGALSIAVIDGPDHTFTPLWSHAALGTVLTAALEAPARRPQR